MAWGGGGVSGGEASNPQLKYIYLSVVKAVPLMECYRVFTWGPQFGCPRVVCFV